MLNVHYVLRIRNMTPPGGGRENIPVLILFLVWERVCLHPVTANALFTQTSSQLPLFMWWNHNCGTQWGCEPVANAGSPQHMGSSLKTHAFNSGQTPCHCLIRSPGFYFSSKANCSKRIQSVSNGLPVGIPDHLGILSRFYGNHILVLGHEQAWHSFCRSCKYVSVLWNGMGLVKLCSFRSAPCYLRPVVKGVIP